MTALDRSPAVVAARLIIHQCTVNECFKTAKCDELLDAVLAAVVAAVAEGEEGLDFEAATLCEAECDDGSRALVYADAALDQQYRAIVGAVKAQLAQSEARVREYEELIERAATAQEQVDKTIDLLCRVMTRKEAP